MVSARVGDILDATQRHIGRNEVRVVGNKRRPFLVLGHGNRAAAQTLNCLVGIVALALEDASKRIVGFLNLTNNDRLKLAAGGFKVEISLVSLVNIHALLRYHVTTHSVEVVLLVNLLLNSAIDAKPDDVRVILASCAAILVIGVLQRLL